MGLLPAGIVLGDVKDVGGFVNSLINRSGLDLGADGRDELEAEAIATLCELWAGFRGGSFSAYASGTLPGRILTSWHKQNRGRHLRSRDAAGRCVWRYRPPIASLESTIAEPGFNEASLRRLGDFTRV
jgi:hypothetical protein